MLFIRGFFFSMRQTFVMGTVSRPNSLYKIYTHSKIRQIYNTAMWTFVLDSEINNLDNLQKQSCAETL